MFWLLATPSTIIFQSLLENGVLRSLDYCILEYIEKMVDLNVLALITAYNTVDDDHACYAMHDASTIR